MYPNIIISLIPAILVLIVSCVTHKMVLSLIIGLISGALLGCHGDLLNTLAVISHAFAKSLSLDAILANDWNNINKLQVYAFLILLGTFIVMLQKSGAALAFSGAIKNCLHSKKRAEQACLLLSASLMIDDYFSSLTVGAIMRPLTDNQGIKRARLALLVDSMSAPLTILCPFSSWVAAIIGFLRDNGIHELWSENTVLVASPMSVYFSTLPFLFYSLLLIVFMWLIVQMQISLDKQPSYAASQIPTTLFDMENLAKLKDFIFPVASLFFCVMFSMLLTGGYRLLGGTKSFLLALITAKAGESLLLGCLSSLCFSSIYLYKRRLLSTKDFSTLLFEGLKLMQPAIVILILAWAFGDILNNQLHTGEHVAIIIKNISITYLPCLLFILSTVIAFIMGSSWGAAAILFPIVIPLIINIAPYGQNSQLILGFLCPILGATLSGCVAGDHLSPISDTSVMTAASIDIPLMQHIKTQLPYGLTVLSISSLSYLLCGLMLPNRYYASIIPILTGVIAILLISLYAKHRAVYQHQH